MKDLVDCNVVDIVVQMENQKMVVFRNKQDNTSYALDYKDKTYLVEWPVKLGFDIL